MKTLTAVIIVMSIGILAFVQQAEAGAIMIGANWTQVQSFEGILYACEFPTIQDAINAAGTVPAYGNKIIDGCWNTYTVTTAINLNQPGLVLQNFNLSYNTDIDILNINQWNTMIRNVNIHSLSARTGGRAINISGDIWQVHINNVFINGSYDNLYVSPSVSRAESLYVDDLRIWNGHNTGIQIFGLTGGFFRDIVTWNPGGDPFTGILLKSGDGISFDNVDIMGSYRCYQIDSSGGSAIKWIDNEKVRCDTGGDGLIVQGDSGWVSGVRFNKFWSSLNARNGTDINGASNNLSGLTFVDSTIQYNGWSGAVLNKGTNVQFVGGRMSGNARLNDADTSKSVGVYASNVKGLAISGMDINKTFEDSTYYQKYGIYLTGTSTNGKITNNNLNNSGTVGTLFNDATGTNSVHLNIGQSSDSYLNGSIPFSLNNGSNVIATGYKTVITVDFSGQIILSRLRSHGIGSINVSYYKADYANYPTTWTWLCNAVLSSGNKLNDYTSCSGKTVAVDDNIELIVNSADVLNATAELTVQIS